MPAVTRGLFFLVVAIICMAIALLLVTGILSGDAQEWAIGGLLAFFLSFLP